MAGLRAVADHRTRNRKTLSLCAALSTRDSELEPRVLELIERAKRQAKELEAAHEELVAFRAAALLESARWIGALRLVATPSGSGAICRSLVQRLGREHDVVALAWSAEGDVALACGSGTAVDAGRLLKELIAARRGKSGGQAELAQGRVEPAELPGLALDLAGRLEAEKGDLARLGRFSREHVTRDGMAFRVREALPSDAVGIAAYVRSVLQGRPMVRTQIEDFTITDDQLAHRLAAARVSETSIYLLAEASAKIVGILDFRGGDRRRLHHAGDFGVTVAEKWRGRAVGRALVMDMIEWCRRTGIVRKINLAVFAENEAARRLYESLGFVEEGRTSRQVAVDGRFVDEINLGLWIGPTA
jgi:RimJ/RimL family protein N-acetyltransferase